MTTRYPVMLLAFLYLLHTAAAQQPSQAEIAKAMKTARARLDSMKKAHPGLAGYSLPDANKLMQQAATDPHKSISQQKQALQEQRY